MSHYQLALPYFDHGEGIMFEGCALGASPSKLSFFSAQVFWGQGSMPHKIDLWQYSTHNHKFELGEEWHINLELELTFNVVSVYNMPILFEDICISSAYQNVLLQIFFYLIKQGIICATHVNFCTEHLKNLPHAVLFFHIYLQGEKSHIR